MPIHRIIGSLLAVLCGVGLFVASRADEPKFPVTQTSFDETVRPLLKAYCLGCHSTKSKKGSLDLERFAMLGDLRGDVKPWLGMIEQIETGEMPPKDKPQPTALEKKRLTTWVRSFLDGEALAKSGDPGVVPARRLSNAEYDATIRDLTGVDLRPTREFPVDGAAGEGFTNAAEALTDISPTLLSKYMAASKEIANRAVLLPNGFRFSQGKTLRDWSDESTAKLRQFYGRFATGDGKTPIAAHLLATVKHRDALLNGRSTTKQVAALETLNAKYFDAVWTAITDKAPSVTLDAIRAKWKTATEKDVPAIVAEIAKVQATVWKVVQVGSYKQDAGKGYAESFSRQVPSDAATDGDKAAFRAVFPLFICFPQVIPTDEVVCLKMFHREDEPLVRLFLNSEQAKELERLWAEHRFISRQPVAEFAYLPQFIGFVTQDQPKAMVTFFESLKPAFQKRAETFLAEETSAIPSQLDALLAFTSKAYRRPLSANEAKALRELYATIRSKGVPHDEAFRNVLARVLVSPAYLFRIEKAPAGKAAGAIDDWELATRLSYFLWSSAPDEELQTLAAAGTLRDPKILAAQAQRMLNDHRVRSLAIEFGTQWIHVRGFDELKEKNEALFPTFDEKLRKAIYEESILFFQDFFQGDRSVSHLLNADATYLNDTLAKHYGIPGVSGPEWRRVSGIRKYGRGGLLGLASVQTKEAGASRTSPILRGNWIVETLLGEKLPKPPPNVPKLPEEEGGADKLTMRQLVERHTKLPECATCHQRIDPFGYSLEKYDPIGRFREKDFGGLPVDAKAKLKDGTEFDGIDGLRTYLLNNKQDVIVRLFCRRLLGYALGRATSLSDTALIDEMVATMKANDGKISFAVQAIVRSPQFRMVRGADTIQED